MFNFEKYIKRVTEANLLARQNSFVFATCSGIEAIEEYVQKMTKVSNFVLLDEVTTGETVRNSGGWYKRRTFVVFIISRVKQFNDQKEREKRMNMLRELQRQLHTRFIHDGHEMRESEHGTCLEAEMVPYAEMGSYALGGVTGLYITVNVDDPTDLVFEAERWNEDVIIDEELWQ